MSFSDVFHTEKERHFILLDLCIYLIMILCKMANVYLLNCISNAFLMNCNPQNMCLK